jgi:type III pantothenate kinase
MLLCLDVGNSHIYGGIFDKERLVFQFRYPSHRSTSDEIGIFLKTYLREINLSPQNIEHIAVCSVVPSLDYSIRSAFIKYFSIDPFFIQAKTMNPIKIGYQNPFEVGADRLANALAGLKLYPKQNLIIVDLGTATTFEVINAQGDFLGGAILPGLALQMQTLNEKTANLPPVKIVKPNAAVGTTTTTNIQSGLYYGHLGAMKLLCEKITAENFTAKPTILGTGGFATLFDGENFFTALHPDLVLQGIRFAYELNQI